MDKNTANVWKLKGRIDSVNAEQIERELSAYAEKTDAEALVLDAKELEYISSAGLRVLLRLLFLLLQFIRLVFCLVYGHSACIERHPGTHDESKDNPNYSLHPFFHRLPPILSSVCVP